MLRIQLELTQLKQEIERRMNEKEDEIETLRYMHVSLCYTACLPI